MKSYSPFPLFLLLIIAFLSCKKQEAPKGFLKYEMKSFSNTEGDSTLKIKGYAEVKLVYPEITEATNETVLSILKNYVNNQILLALFKEGRYKKPEFLIENFLSEYKKFKDSNPNSSLYWKLERVVNVAYSSSRFVCFKFVETSYLGGAHPNTNCYYANYDLTTGAKLELKDIFVEGFESKLFPLAEKKFREARGLKPSESLEDAGYHFPDNKFRINNNLGFTNDGIIFFYNPYEVAPYSFGATIVELAYKEIEGLIRKEFYKP